ncbi:MAG: lipopolysaccharide biosynthesis protein [Lachnospiraceae bacterium]|jgi:O-antigen/teichoic acid export membrane protein|nr:lipopolysaccharide biosynthesis protein [Lachnospiraceae bacterium]
MINKIVYRFLNGNENCIKRDCFVWNTIAGGVNAAEAVVLMMVITRTNGVDAAGILSIAFALGNLLMTIGKFGVRNYQVTDVNNEYSFNTYHTMRIYTVLLMAAIAACYVTIKAMQGGYSVEKSAVVLAICLIYVVESYEDVYLGHLQLNGRLDVASKIFIIRWILLMFVFCVLAVFSRYLLLSVVVSLIISVLCEIYLLRLCVINYQFGQIRIDNKYLNHLIKQSFALFISAFLTYYVTNAPKYAIDSYLSEDIQAYYGYISMPVFVVELLNCFLYQPQMVRLADEWNQKSYDSFNRKVAKQYAIIFGLTLLCVAGAYLCGIPVLSVIYGVSLNQYKVELIILMISGGALAYVGYTSVLLTIMRKQTILLCNLIIITVAAFAGFGRAVKVSGMRGAAIYYLILMCVLAILNFCCTIAVENKCKKEQIS